jgi:hypothetical protein
MTDEEAVAKIKCWCAERLERFKIPAKIEITSDKQHNLRFKKMRKAPAM